MPGGLEALLPMLMQGGAHPAAGGGGGAEMDALLGMQESPQPSGEDAAMQDATQKLGFALSRVYLRSPEAAKMLSEAVTKIQAARKALQQEGSRPVSSPPSLSMAEQGFVPGITG